MYDSHLENNNFESPQGTSTNCVERIWKCGPEVCLEILKIIIWINNVRRKWGNW